MSSKAARKNRLRRSRRANKRLERGIIKGTETKLVSAITDMEEEIKRSGAEPDEDLLRQREQALLKTINAYPDVKLLRGLAKCRDASWLPGQLYLLGAINKHQLSGAEHAQKVRSTFLEAIYSNGVPKAVDYGKIRGHSKENMSDSAVKAFRRVQRQFEKVEKALDKCGWPVKEAVLQTLRGNLGADLTLVRTGLDAVYEIAGRK